MSAVDSTMSPARARPPLPQTVHGVVCPVGLLRRGDPRDSRAEAIDSASLQSLLKIVSGVRRVAERTRTEARTREVEHGRQGV